MDVLVRDVFGLYLSSAAMPKSLKSEQVRRRTTSDPLAAAMLPPANESPVDRENRLQAEQQARRVSEKIDEELRQERKNLNKSRPEVSVLLLGQSESGKSTTLKQFQLLHTPAAFHAERIAWRAVIYLNLVKSVIRILDALAPEQEAVEDHEEADTAEADLVIISADGRPPSAIQGTRVPNYDSYRHKLEPLLELGEKLTRLLSSPDEEEPTHLGPTWGNYVSQLVGTENQPPMLNGRARPAPTIVIPPKKQTHASLHQSNGFRFRGEKEVVVHTTTNWKKTFALGGNSKSPKSAHSGEIEGWWEDPDDPVHALNACAPAMMELWRDRNVRKRLKEKKIRLEETSGFYLDEIPRITAKKYIPTDADVLKARLKTMGVIEHTFSIPHGLNRGVEWRIYDVGGARNQRQAWAPYFEDVNAIIFLAPISAFDQHLTEDPRVNRLEDSLLLWKAVVSNKLLANVNIVLFLNKIDLLQSKLEAGVRLNKHMNFYGDRPNDYDSVSKYFRNKFGAIHVSYTPNKERELYIHLTAVTDTRRTSIIIADVRDIIIKGNLRNMRLV
ncbi:guanine nucleotide binding protein, alpha subunit [Ephemerocybe angulata]|uniref:Guanine nucleotide binding protein, alpha subunit n=1 Tax=Ephemerocybe angulata TaxID=980116 RepID=A0A8H6M4C3_9AGAR|nr:guanine nucleotide binding protein, alpha subunit [Tulosesus angulatus]